MNKKLAILSVLIVITILLSGFNSIKIFGTEYAELKPGYSFTISSGEDWFDCNWTYCKQITIDHTKVEENQVNYPVLINTSSDLDLVVHAQSNGEDIIFVNSYNSTQFKHEIEKYDSGTGELVAWVKVDSISASADTVFYMYYGNPSCANQENVTGTWDSNFIMVNHLDDNSNPLGDSTSYWNNGTNSGATYNNSAKINGGYNFDGGDSISCGNSSSLNITGSITLEGWMRDPPVTSVDDKKNIVKIVDKKEEYLNIRLGKKFQIERTIQVDQADEIIFVALFSSGVKLSDMIVTSNSVYNGTFSKENPGTYTENRIEQIRKKLPDKIQDLEYISYSKPFKIQDLATVKMFFSQFLNNDYMFNGRISYLVISSDDEYDYETTTHWDQSCSFNDLIMKSMLDNIKSDDGDIFSNPFFEDVVADDETSFAKMFAVNPWFKREDNSDFKISVPEVRYPFQVDFVSLTNQKQLDDFDLEDSNNNGLYDCVKCCIDKISEVFATSVDYTMVDYKDDVSDHIDNGNGTYTSIITNGAKNYYDKITGRFKPINSVIKESDSDEYVFENTENVVESYFSKSGMVKFKNKDSHVIFYLIDQDFGGINSNYELNVENNTITYENIYDDIDVRYDVGSGGLLEEFIVYKPMNITTVSERFETTNDVNYKEMDDGSICFYNQDNEGVFVIPAPLMWEDENKEEKCDGLHYEITQKDNTLIISKIIDEQGKKWLEDENRTYPVVIDTTTIIYSTAQDGRVQYTGSVSWAATRGASTGITFSNSESSSSAGIYSAFLQGTPPFTPDRWTCTRSFFEFDTSSLPDDDIIDSASVRIRGLTNADTTVCILTGTQGSALDNDDYNAYSAGLLTESPVSWSSSGWNIFTLNPTGLSRISKTGSSYYCLRDYPHDYVGGNPSLAPQDAEGCYYNDSGGSYVPYMYITHHTNIAPDTSMENFPETAGPSDVATITGSAADEDGTIAGVYLLVINNTDGTMWCGEEEGWGGECAEQQGECGYVISASATDGDFDEQEEDWTYTPEFEWVDGKSYTINAKAEDNDDECDSTEASDTFTYSDTNNPPVINEEGLFPENDSKDICLQPTCHAAVSDEDSDYMDVLFFENSTSSWICRQTNSSVSTGTTCKWNYSQASSGGTKYWWRVVAYDLNNETPTSDSDPSSGWTDDDNARDDDTGTCATCTNGEAYLYLNLTSAEDCRQIWFIACGLEGGKEGETAMIIEYDTGGGSYEIVYEEGVSSSEEWRSVIINDDGVARTNSVRILFPEATGEEFMGRLYELKFTTSDADNETFHFTTASTGNDPPYVENVTVHCAHDFTLDNLNVSYDYIDNESDGEEGTSWDWYEGPTQSGPWTDMHFNTTSLDKNYTNETKYYRCKVTPRNATATGDSVNSSAFLLTSLNESAGTYSGTYVEAGNLTIANSGSLTISGTLDIEGNVTIFDTGTINFGSNNHEIGSLSVDHATCTASSGTIYITSEKTSTGYAVYFDAATFTNNSGTIQINTSSATEIDIISTDSDIYDLIINAGSTVDWDGNSEIGDDLTISAGTFQPKGHGDILKVTDETTVNGGTLGGNDASGIWILGSLDLESGTVAATTGTIYITSEDSDGYAVDLDDTYTNNSGTIQINTSTDTLADIDATGDIYDLIINSEGGTNNIDWVGSADIGNDLTVTSGIFRPFVSGHDITVTNNATVNGGTLGGNSADAKWYFGSLYQPSGTIDATTDKIYITNENDDYAIDLDGTFTNNSGEIIIITADATEIDITPSSGAVYDLTIDAGSTVDWHGNIEIGDDLTIPAGTFQPNTATDILNVSDNTTISGGTLGGNTAEGIWITGALYQSSGTIDATTSTIYIKSESDNFAIDLDGTYTNNSGTIQINTTTATEADIYATSGTIYDLIINTGSTIDWTGYSEIGDDLTISAGTFQPNAAGDKLNVTDNLTLSSGTLGGNSADADWVTGSLYQASGTTIDATTGTIYITKENDDYAIDLEGTYTNNSGTIQINTTAATEADITPSTGTVYDLIINAGSTVDWQGNIEIGDDLTISAGTFQPNTATDILNVTDNTTISGGTLGGNTASGIWITGSLYQSSGTIDATTSTIYITSESDDYAIDLEGTYTNNSGTIQINTTTATEADIYATSGTIYDLIINTGSTIDWNGYSEIGDDLTINSGTLQPNAAGDILNVTDNLTLSSGTLGGNSADGNWITGSLYQVSGTTIDATSGTIYITKENDDYAIDLEGTYTNNSGTIQINTTAATEADITPSTGTVYDLIINAGSTVDWHGNIEIGDDLTIPAGTFQPNTATDILNVSDNTTISGGTLGGNTASGIWITGSLYQSSGTIDATTSTIYITSESDDYAIDLEGTYTNNSGTIQINTTDATKTDLVATGDVYDLIIKTGSTIDWVGNTMIGDDLTVTSGTFQPDSASNTLKTTDNVTVNGGTLGGNSASGDWGFGSLYQSSGTIDATSGTININSEDDDYAIDIEGTFTDNSGIVEINTGADTNIDITGTGNLYDLIIDTSGHTVTNKVSATLDNDATIQAGTFDLEADLTLAQMDVDSGATFNIKSSSTLTMSDILTLDGDFKIISGNSVDVTLNGTKFNLTNGNNIQLHPTPIYPPNPNNWYNITKFVNLSDIGASPSVDINVTYLNSDLGSIDENTLVMKEYNWGTNTWTTATSTGVNTAGNYVWANDVTSFSGYGPLGQQYSAPTVQTNETTGVEETNATVHGWLQNNGSADTTCYLLVNDTNDFGDPLINITKGVIANNTDFSDDTTEEETLTAGTLYYVKAQASNSQGWTLGNLQMFLTKPQTLSDFTAIAVSGTQIDLSWTNGVGGDGAYIEYASGSPPSPWNVGDGTPVDADGNVTTPFNHVSLTDGTHYYYKAWAYATDGGWTSSGNTTSPRGDNPQTADATTFSLPTVQTNATTGIEETNATLWGWLSSNGSDNTTCYFLLNDTNDFGSPIFNISKGVIDNNAEFNNDTAGDTTLSPGTIYYVDTKANNSVGWDESGGVQRFLTKPNAPTSLSVHANNSTIMFLTWVEGTGANNTYIERNDTGQTSWAREQGVEVYNGTGSLCEITGLVPGTTYYFQLWSYSEWTYDSTTLHQFSDDNASGSNTTHYLPELSNENPANQSTDASLNPTLSIDVDHENGFSMDIRWFWGTDSSCSNYIGSNMTVGNGTYTMDNDNNFSSNSQKYYWKVCVQDNHSGWTNETYWFTTIGANKEIISKEQSAYSLELGPYGTTLYGYINSNSVSTSISLDMHYVVLTYDGSKMRLYIDGELKNSEDQSGAINTNENHLMLGEYLTGTLDELRISNTARSTAWINTTYMNTNTPTTFATVGSQIGSLTTWSYRKQIWINKTLVDDDMTNFPILISTTDVNLKNNANSNGGDILFTNSSVDWKSGAYTEKLDHEIEKYDSGTGELVAWVELDSISSNVNTSIYMYYSNTLCTANRSNPTGVWDSNFKLVHHLEETSNPHLDSTSNDNDGNESGGVNQDVTGKVDGADSFAGDDDCVNFTNSNSLNFNTGDFSYSVWFKVDDLPVDTYQILCKRATDSGNYEIQVQSTGKIRAYFEDSPDVMYLDSNTTMTPGIWYHAAVVRDSGTATLYINGTAENTSGSNHNIDSDGWLNIGRDVVLESEYFKGDLDELRISNTARNTSWVNTAHNTMNASSSFVEFGVQEIQNVAPALSNPIPAEEATGVSLNPTLYITINDVNSNLMNVTFRTNASGSWTDIESNNTVPNGTYSQTTSNMNSYNKKYYWKACVFDGTTWTNRTYNFTTSGLALYAFNSYSAGEAWPTNPGNMVDGDTGTHANTTDDADVQLLDGDNCSGTDLGTIVSVELRVYGNYSTDKNPADIILRPVFGGASDGDNHVWSDCSDTPGWSDWYNITGDPNAPSPWTWTDVQNLDCDVEADGTPDFDLGCHNVEIKVTYS